MLLFDFISETELENLSEDPHEAFLTIAIRCQESLVRFLASLPDDEEGWSRRNDAMYSFKNVLVAAAVHYGISQIADSSISKRSDYTFEEFQNFRGMIENYVTQAILMKGKRRRTQSVGLQADVKILLNHYLDEIRKIVGESNLPDWRKENLYTKLNEFESELSKSRLSITAVGIMLIGIMAATNDSVEFYDRVKGVLNKVAATVGVAREAEQLQSTPLSLPDKLRLPDYSEPSKTSQDEFDDIPF